MPKRTEDGENYVAMPGDTYIDYKTGEVYDVILDVQRVLHPKEILTCRSRTPLACDIAARSQKEGKSCYDIICQFDSPDGHIYCNNGQGRSDPILFRLRRPKS